MTSPGLDGVRAALKLAAEKTVAVRIAAEAEAARLHAEREAAQGDAAATKQEEGK